MEKLKITSLLHNTITDGIELLPSVMSSVWFCRQKLFIADNSTKQAKDLAEKFGFEIHEYKGKDSMADRRNFGISKAKYDLMLQVDSDEIYEPDAYHKLKWSMEQKDFDRYNCYAVLLENYDTDRNVLMSVSPLERLYRKGAVFEKSIQNELKYEGQPKAIPVRLSHYGYSSSIHPRKQWDRIKHNEEEVRRKPNDLHTRMYLINSLAVAGSGSVFMYERALAHTCISIRMYLNDKSELNKRAIQKVARFFFVIACSVGYQANFLQVIEPIIKDISFHPDSHMFMFKSYLDLNNRDQALKWGESFMKSLDQTDPMMQAIEITSTKEREWVKGAMIHLLEQKDDKWSKRQIKRWKNK